MALPTISNSISTTDATPTTILTVNIPANTIRGVDGYVIARRTGGAAGAAEDGAFYRISIVYNNIAGNAQIIGEDLAIVGENQESWSITTTTSGANLLIQVTGAINNNINWTGYVSILSQA